MILGAPASKQASMQGNGVRENSQRDRRVVYILIVGMCGSYLVQLLHIINLSPDGFLNLLHQLGVFGAPPMSASYDGDKKERKKGNPCRGREEGTYSQRGAWSGRARAVLVLRRRFVRVSVQSG